MLRVLIVEDDRAMRELIKRMIRDLVESFSECSDGAQALDVYAAHRPDWVLMDIRMKDVDGLTATQQITNAWPGARVVIVTSYNDVSLREAARQAGACQYVLKENLVELRSILAAP
jgi:CheY-like chemotaxis protein